MVVGEECRITWNGIDVPVVESFEENKDLLLRQCEHRPCSTAELFHERARREGLAHAFRSLCSQLAFQAVRISQQRGLSWSTRNVGCSEAAERLSNKK